MECELSIVMPCLNEARSLPVCIAKAREFLATEGIAGEIIVADNGSTDGSPEIAESLNVRVVRVERKGYGCALAVGIKAARGRYVVMADSDGSYDLSKLMPFVKQLRDGADLVMGNRFDGGIARGAMPLSHRYFGNPLLSLIGRVLFRSRCGDFYCGLRAFTKEAFERMDLKSRGMEFALEMPVKATLLGMDVREVPTTLEPDLRTRPPHLRRWRDGLRSLYFYLMLSPRWVLWYPGIMLTMAGLLGLLVLSLRPVGITGLMIGQYGLLISSVATILGIQIATVTAAARYAAIRRGLVVDTGKLTMFMPRIRPEVTVLVGGLIVLAGLVGVRIALRSPSLEPWQEVDDDFLMRIFVPSLTAVILGAQAALFGVILGIIRAVRKRAPLACRSTP